MFSSRLSPIFLGYRSSLGFEFQILRQLQLKLAMKTKYVVDNFDIFMTGLDILITKTTANYSLQSTDCDWSCSSDSLVDSFRYIQVVDSLSGKFKIQIPAFLEISLAGYRMNFHTWSVAQYP